MCRDQGPAPGAGKLPEATARRRRNLQVFVVVLVVLVVAVVVVVVVAGVVVVVVVVVVGGGRAYFGSDNRSCELSPSLRVTNPALDPVI